MAAPSTNLALWWRLAYPDGTYVTEPRERASIRIAPRGAVALQIISPWFVTPGAGLVEVRIAPGERPVFYRRRGVNLDGYGVVGDDAVVYGVAFEAHGPRSVTVLALDQVTQTLSLLPPIEARIRCILPGVPGYDHVVPAEFIDAAAIRRLYEG